MTALENQRGDLLAFWNADAALRREFNNNFDAFFAFEMAAARGLVRIYSPHAGRTVSPRARGKPPAADTVAPGADAQFVLKSVRNPTNDYAVSFRVLREADGVRDLVALAGEEKFREAARERWNASASDRAAFGGDYATFESYIVALARGQTNVK